MIKNIIKSRPIHKEDRLLPNMKPRELTLEFKDVEELDELQLIKIHSTLRSLKRSLKRQLAQYPEWDNTLRIQAVILCKECSNQQQAQVEMQSSKNIRLTRCLHLTQEKIDVKD